MSRKFTKVAIANRGEVAVRIIHACHELGIRTLLLHSEADADSYAARLSDEVACIGPAAVKESYLNIEVNVLTAVSQGADAIHPGFGFLSENADFAERCQQAGLIFIGPSPQSIRLFGDKISAKKLVVAAGGPTIPGYDGKDQRIERLIEAAELIGFPVIAKAAAGGGGRGLKVIRNREEAQAQIESAQRECLSAFGSATVFLEKYLDHAKHIEVQIFGDASGRIFCLGERECSIQRRHQKIIEEASAPLLDDTLRAEIHATAVAIAKQANYQNAGTVEFLLQDDEFYFMEMNTRLQVEHPVTELVMGVDLVKAQILTAMKQALFWEEHYPRGHAIECRIYAEDPYNKGMPSLGQIGACLWPYGPGRRFDVGVEAGDVVTSHYDAMIAKVIVWDESRPRAIHKMRQVLRETVIFGVQTNIPLLQEMLSHPEFISGDMTTGFFAAHFSEHLERPTLSTPALALVEKLQRSIGSSDPLMGSGVNENTSPSPWQSDWESK